ncbi:MAG: endolytic transglycosylase MltG, partial [[Clostridium] cellulosi]
YEFYVDQAPDAVVKKMLKNFETRFDESFRKATQASGMTVDEVITLASIIQAESSNKDQMAKVSSVFHNRLKNGVNGKKLLQSDATIFYATRDIEPILPVNSTNIASAYNTYKHEGLPPGPICNPGLAAIDAALSPADTKYYYFVTDKNGNYYYAETFAKHLVNVRKAENTGKAGGTNVTKSDD